MNGPKRPRSASHARSSGSRGGRVLALNRAGEATPSATVTAVL
jgi:hypothetical protein